MIVTSQPIAHGIANAVQKDVKIIWNIFVNYGNIELSNEQRYSV